jgi:hypothetical protein
MEEIVEQLGQAGVSVWTPNWIEPGTNWQVELVQALDQSVTFLFVLSPNSLSSDSCIKELEYANSKKKRIVPIQVDEIDPSAVPEYLHGYTWKDFRDGEDRFLHDFLKGMDEGQISPCVEVAKKNKGYVFLSYAFPDIEFVDGLKDFLKENSYGYWDYQESNRNYHNQLVLELEEAILGSTALFVILSDSWKRSKWTLREYFFAEEAGIPIFLLRVRKMSPTLAIAGMPYIDFETDEMRGFEKLDHELKRKGF